MNTFTPPTQTPFALAHAGRPDEIAQSIVRARERIFSRIGPTSTQARAEIEHLLSEITALSFAKGLTFDQRPPLDHCDAVESRVRQLLEDSVGSVEDIIAGDADETEADELLNDLRILEQLILPGTEADNSSSGHAPETTYVY